MDYLSLFAAAKLLSRTTTWLRTAFAAVLGGLYGVSAVICGIGGLWGALAAVAVSAVMALITFGIPTDGFAFFRLIMTVWGCGALLGGIMTALSGAFGGVYPGRGTDLVIAGTAMLFGLLRPIRRRLTKGYVQLSIPYEERVWQGRALIDSGNLLTDPISGCPVVLLRAEEARTLIGALTDTLYRGIAENATLGVRAVPIHTIDGTRILYGFFAGNITVSRGRRQMHRTAVVCIDHGADPQNGYGGCAALLPASLLL